MIGGVKMLRKKMGEFQAAKLKGIDDNSIIINDPKALNIGVLGDGRKIMIFKEKEFKEELAPPNAKLEKFELNGEKYIRMIYTLKR